MSDVLGAGRTEEVAELAGMAEVPRRPGRFCPLDYQLAESLFTADARYKASTLYIVGGLYGNPEAATACRALVEQDGDCLLVLNGDIHWFDADAETFWAIEDILDHERIVKLLGNVEAELRREEGSGNDGADDSVGCGCGCAYPESEASDDTVERSNEIHRQLKAALKEAAAERYDALMLALQDRPSTLVVEVDGQRVAISHGDETSLAGWGCSRASLAQASRRQELFAWMSRTNISVLATSHTCSPAALSTDSQAAINNGAAGMPSFPGQDFGLISRVAAVSHPVTDALYRTQLDDIIVEAVPLRYHAERFLSWFDTLWPAGSPAAISYRDRIVSGDSCSSGSLCPSDTPSTPSLPNSPGSAAAIIQGFTTLP